MPSEFHGRRSARATLWRAIASFSVESLEPRTMLASAARVHDIIAGSDSSVILDSTNSVASNGKLIFAATDEAHGMEIWISDGTPTGTSIIKDINTGQNGSAPDELIAGANGIVYFSADDGIGRQVWKTDGTPGGTSKISSASSSPIFLRYLNGKVLFFTFYGSGLYRTDATGAQSVIDANAGAATWLGEAGGKLFISARGADGDDQLWVTDGTTAAAIKDPDSSSNLAFFDPGVALGNTLIFGMSNGLQGEEPGRSDGTTGGTSILSDLNHADFSGSSPQQFTLSGGSVYFVANDGAKYQIYRSDGSGVTKITSLPGTDSSASIRDLTDFNGTLYFSYGPTGGTRLLYRLVNNTTPQRVGTATGGADGGTRPGFLKVAGNTLYFSALDNSEKARIFQTDGTTISAVTGDAGLDPTGLINVSGTLYYSSTDDAHGSELHVVTNGTTPEPPKYDINLKTIAGFAGDVRTSVYEGSSLTFRAELSDKTKKVTWKWDFEGNGKFKVAGSKPTYTYTDGGRNPTKKNVRVKAFVDGKPVAEERMTISVLNVAPSVKIKTPKLGITIKPISATIQVSDVGKLDKLSCVVDWGDGSITGPFNMKNPAKTTLTHVYATVPPTIPVTVTARVFDSDGAKGENVSHIAVASALTIAENIVIGGTSGRDIIKILAPIPGQYEVFVNGVKTAFEAGRDVGIEIWGGAGDDRIEVNGSIFSAVKAFGGLGIDTIFGGSGNDSLYGNDGKDKLYGGEGDNLIKQ